MKRLILPLQLPILFSLFGCMEVATPPRNDDAAKPVKSQTDEWSKGYINSTSGQRDAFAKGKVYSKPDLANVPTEVGEVEWPAEALAKSAAFTPYVQNVSVTTTTTCPALQGRITVDMNEGSGGKYIYICWGQDDGIADNSSVPGGTMIRQIQAENFYATLYGQGLVNLDAVYGDYYRVGGTESCSSSGCYRYGGTITGRYIKPVNGSDGDMNQDAGGDFIYLYKWYTSAYSPYARLRNLSAVSGGSSITCPSGNNRYYVHWDDSNIPADMNNNAGGRYIYVCQQLY